MGKDATIMSVSIGSIVSDTMMPPKSSSGARMPMRWIMPTVWCKTYVSLVIREISDGIVNASTLLSERYEIFRNRSCRICRVQSRATADAMRFAVMLPPHAISEHTIINPPHRHTGRISFSGIRSSMIYDKIHGIASSTSVPTALKLMPMPIRGKNGFKYTASLFKLHALFPLRSSQ